MSNVNQQVIAEKLGLSRTTVSRCFTNHPKINPQTRSKVLQLASQLGYQYSAQRNPSNNNNSNNRNTIAVLVGIPPQQIQEVDTASDVLDGVSERVTTENLKLELHYVDPASFAPSPRPRKILPCINSADWKGILLLYPFPEESINKIRHKIPMLSIMDSYDELDIDCVDTDQVHGIRKLMSHLYEQGHREFGFLSWKYRVSADWVSRRMSGFIESLIHHNLEYKSENLLNVRPTEEIPLQRLAETVASRVRQGVTAWICAADHQAYDLCARLKKFGISIPRDCSVTGFDGVEPPDDLPRVTSIRIPLFEIGYSAAHALLRRMNSPGAQRRHILVTGEVIIGDTTGPVPEQWRTKL